LLDDELRVRPTDGVVQHRKIEGTCIADIAYGPGCKGVEREDSDVDAVKPATMRNQLAILCHKASKPERHMPVMPSR
jgi:hypothetical protein